MYDMKPELPVATRPANWPEPEQLGFGQYLGDWMVAADHTSSGWSAPVAARLSDTRTPVASAGVQYGLTVFEGLKTFRGPDGQAHLFRPYEHAARLRQSALRLGMPVVSDELFVEACRMASRIHEPLLPPFGRGSLYLRPTLMADEEALGFRVASRHRFSVAVTPSSEPVLKTFRLWAERELTRAAPGGLGAAKTGGNYAAGMLGLIKSRERGCDDVLWLDSATHSKLGEAGTMNLFVEIDHRLCTPPLDGTILAGVTRDTLIRLAREEGVVIEERELPLDELSTLERAGRVGCAFGLGTAARLVRIREIVDGGRAIGFHDVGRAEHYFKRLKVVQEGGVEAHAEWRVAVD